MTPRARFGPRAWVWHLWPIVSEAMPVKYHIPPSKQWAVLRCSLVCHCKCHHFSPWLATKTGTTLSSALSPLPSILPFHKDPPFPLPCLLFSTTHFCIHFPHVARDCLGKGIFRFNLTFSQGKTKRGHKLSAAGFTEKIVQNCPIPGQISKCIQSLGKCYCTPQFSHYTLSFPFSAPRPN